jgi:hypothetical protein
MTFMDKVIFPIQIIITGMACLVAIFVKGLLLLHKPVSMLKLWFQMRIVWKLNRIHQKLNKRKKK